GVEEARINPQVNNFEFLHQICGVLQMIEIAKRKHDEGILPSERKVYAALDAFVEHFPDVSSKLWTDIRLILLSSHLPGSPLHDYRKILESDTIDIKVSSLKSETPFFEVFPSQEDASDESIDSFLPFLLIKNSYQNVKAFSLIEDALYLALTTIGIAHAVDKYSLARVQFGSKISLENIAHPLFYTERQKEGAWKDIFAFRPNTLHFSPEEQLLFITGPTEGGKTTVARSLGMAILMGHAFGYACASSAQMPLFTQMFSSFTHQDDFQSGTSTFKSEVNSLNRQYQLMDDRTFFAGDETLRTSEPSVGPELIPSITKALLAKGIKGVIATHYHDAIRELERDARIQCRYIDPRNFYALREGVSPGGYAFESAQRAGLHPDMLGARAGEKYISPKKELQTFSVHQHTLSASVLPKKNISAILETTSIPQTQAVVKTRLDPLQLKININGVVLELKDRQEY
ncbi:MAG: hypothetical protein Q7K45_06150, partial [Nanoarchaeota archaeon]|nr:hypothetical protein [Nanoarchaeota archaeon]